MDHTKQCQIQGRGLGPPNPHSAPLFLVQTEAQMAEKSFFETGPPFSQDLDDSPPPLIWRSGSATANPLGYWVNLQ